MLGAPRIQPETSMPDVTVRPGAAREILVFLAAILVSAAPLGAAPTSPAPRTADSAVRSLAEFPSPQPDPSVQQEILLLFSEDPTAPWTGRFAEGFADVAERNAPVPVLYFEYLDIARFHDNADVEAFRTWLVSKYQRRDIDIVVPIGEPAMQFVADHREQLWPQAGVYFLATHRPDATMRQRLGGAGGLVMEDHLQSALEVMSRVLPDTNRLALARGVSPAEAEWSRSAPEVARRLSLEFVDLAGLSMAETLARVRQLPRHSLLLILGPLVDSQGRVTPAPQLCQQLSSAADVPAIMLGGQNLGCGILGGLLRDFKIIGQHVAERALMQEQRHGEVAILPKETFTSIAFDARQLARWGISESRLPPGSTVAFRRPNLWRDYRLLVLLAIGAIAFQSALIAGLLYERWRRRRAEDERRRDLAIAIRAGRLAAVGELTASVAHELAHPLGAILHNVKAAQLMIGAPSSDMSELEPVLASIAEEDGRATGIIARIRGLVQKRDMQMVPVDLNGIVNDSVRLMQHEALGRNVQLETELDGTPCVITGDSIALQQVVMNLLMNAMEAMTDTPVSRRRIVVTTTTGRGGIELSIRDGGAGIPADIATRMFEPFVTTKPQGLGIGLSIVRSIVTAHGGHIDAENIPGGGAAVRIWLPCRAAA